MFRKQKPECFNRVVTAKMREICNDGLLESGIFSWKMLLMGEKRMWASEAGYLHSGANWKQFLVQCLAVNKIRML